LIVLRRARFIDVEPMALAETSVVDARHSTEQVQELLATLRPIHFPIEFPEIFSGPQPGFQCILGNPPWEEIMVDEDTFWATKSPGLGSLKGKARLQFMSDLASDHPDWLLEHEGRVTQMRLLRECLTAGPYPDLNLGNADFYKAFCWRFWSQVANQGVVGVVLPRNAVSARGSASWRKQVLDTGDFIEVTVGQNRGGWLFEDVGDLITIALVSIQKTGQPDDVVGIRGPFSSFAAYESGLRLPATELSTNDLRSWSEGASFPLIPNSQAFSTFLRLRQSNNLADVFTVRPVQGDFNATTGRKAGHFSVDMDTEQPGALPVLGGASFNIWEPDTGVRKGWADPAIAIKELQRKRTSGSSKKSSAFYGFGDDWISDESTLAVRNCRIAFRDVARATDGRTVIAALLPAEIVLTNDAPYLFWSDDQPTHAAYLLGVLCSTPLDWYARRFVELHVNFFIFNRFPIPTPNPTDDKYLRTVEIAGRLAAVDDRYASWAEAVGVPVASATTQADKDALVAELDAVVAHLYGLDAEDLQVIWKTFYEKIPRNDYRPSLDKVLSYHEDWTQ